MKRYLQAIWDKAEKANEDNVLSMLDYNPNAVLLDCGCADGEFTSKIATKIGTQNISGIEIVEELIDKARKRGISVKQSDLNGNFPFEDGSIDVLVANQVVEHLYDTDNFISKF
jgi:trans-aconitate methyltransferase